MMLQTYDHTKRIYLIGIIGNEIADQLANSGALVDKSVGTPMIHTTHTGSMESQHVPTRVLYTTYKHTSTRNT